MYFKHLRFQYDLWIRRNCSEKPIYKIYAYVKREKITETGAGIDSDDSDNLWE